MMLLGLNEGISLKKISDFEYFDRWEKVLPLAAGHKAVKNYEKELSEIGLSLPDEPYSRERSIRRWREINAEIYGDITEARPEISVEPSTVRVITPSEKPYSIYDLTEKVKQYSSSVFNATELSKAICEEIARCCESDVIIKLRVQDCDYVRPTPYLAQLTLNKKERGEDLSKRDENSLSFQLLILTILEISNTKKITIELYGCTECALEFISYLGRRGLFSGEIRVEIHTPELLPNFTITAIRNHPIIWVRPMLIERNSEHSIDRYRSDYPISAFYFLTKS